MLERTHVLVFDSDQKMRIEVSTGWGRNKLSLLIEFHCKWVFSESPKSLKCSFRTLNRRLWRLWNQEKLLHDCCFQAKTDLRICAKSFLHWEQIFHKKIPGGEVEVRWRMEFGTMYCPKKCFCASLCNSCNVLCLFTMHDQVLQLPIIYLDNIGGLVKWYPFLPAAVLPSFDWGKHQIICEASKTSSKKGQKLLGTSKIEQKMLRALPNSSLHVHHSPHWTACPPPACI